MIRFVERVKDRQRMPVKTALCEWMRRMRSTFWSASSSTRVGPLIIGWLSTFVVLAMLQVAPVFGEDSKDPFEDLRIRIAQLEKDNHELRTALSKAPIDEALVPTISELPPIPPEPDPDEAKSPDERKMDSLVDSLIRRMETQNRAAMAAQDQKIAALESKLNAKPKPTSATGNFGPTGLVFTSADGNFKAHVGGTAQLDFIAPQSHASGIGGFGPPNQNLTQDSTNFRRLRMRADGTMYNWIDWVSEFDFAGFVVNTDQRDSALAPTGLRDTPGAGVQAGNTINVIQPTTVWMTFKDVPVVQNIRVGNQQDWFSIEHITSARYLDFMERAPIMDIFSGPNNNGYTPGVSVFGNTEDKNAGLQLGVYKNNAYDTGFTYSIGNAFTYGGRAIWTPYYDEESQGRYLVHTGLGAEYRSFDTDLPANQTGFNVRARSRGDLRLVSATLTPNFIDTGNFFALGQSLIDPEIAVVWGPWTVQAEYCAGWYNGARVRQNGPGLGTVLLTGGYVEALYFWTGENKAYNRQTGLFGQVIPKNNVNFCEGKYGAWQSGVRYDWTDANSGMISGGYNQNGTLGLNWFLNPNIRFQFNTVFSYINNGPVNSTFPDFALASARLIGDGLLVTLGTRMDISF